MSTKVDLVRKDTKALVESLEGRLKFMIAQSRDESIAGLKMLVGMVEKQNETLELEKEQISAKEAQRQQAMQLQQEVEAQQLPQRQLQGQQMQVVSERQQQQQMEEQMTSEQQVQKLGRPREREVTLAQMAEMSRSLPEQQRLQRPTSATSVRSAHVRMQQQHIAQQVAAAQAQA